MREEWEDDRTTFVIDLYNVLLDICEYGRASAADSCVIFLF
jgi:hypothetical protein